MVATEPRFEHREFNENLYEWSERYIPDGPTHYTCKFCPGRGEEPEEVDHSRRCPVFRQGGDA